MEDVAQGGYIVPGWLADHLQLGTPIPEPEPVDCSHDMAGVREYDGELPVMLLQKLNGMPCDRWIIEACAGGDSTFVDLFDLLNWLCENREDLLQECGLRRIAMWNN